MKTLECDFKDLCQKHTHTADDLVIFSFLLMTEGGGVKGGWTFTRCLFTFTLTQSLWWSNAGGAGGGVSDPIIDDNRMLLVCVCERDLVTAGGLLWSRPVFTMFVCFRFNH